MGLQGPDPQRDPPAAAPSPFRCGVESARPIGCQRKHSTWLQDLAKTTAVMMWTKLVMAWRLWHVISIAQQSYSAMPKHPVHCVADVSTMLAGHIHARDARAHHPCFPTLNHQYVCTTCTLLHTYNYADEHASQCVTLRRDPMYRP